MNLLLSFLEKIGRKYAFVDFYGDVLFYRYYVFFFEKHIDDRFIAKLPNVYIHVYNSDKNGDGPNLEGSHNHPWSTLGFLLKGSYTEIIDESIERTTNRFGFAYLSHKQKHKLIKVEQDTTSIFMHWFRKNFWKVHYKKCEVICDTCGKLNNGVCNKIIGSNHLDDHLEFTNKSISDGKTWRALTILKVDKDFNKIIEKRKRTLDRMGIKNPGTLREKLKEVKIAQIKNVQPNL